MKTTLLIISTTLGLLASQSRADRLVIKGSDTLGAKLVPQLAEAFKANHPDTTFDIAAEGSTTGIAAIIDGTAQIGMASRRAKPAEVGAASGKGINMKPTIVAYDGIAVIVNSANPIKGLTKKQVEQIFTGDVTDWSAIGGSPGQISVYTRNTSSGTYSDFKELAMKKRDYAPSGQKMAGNEQIASEVGKNANGVGYVGLAYTKAGGIKVMPIDGAIALDQDGAVKELSLCSTHLLLHQWRPEWSCEGIRRFHDQSHWPKDRPTGRLCADQIVPIS